MVNTVDSTSYPPDDCVQRVGAGNRCQRIGFFDARAVQHGLGKDITLQRPATKTGIEVVEGHCRSINDRYVVTA